MENIKKFAIVALLGLVAILVVTGGVSFSLGSSAPGTAVAVSTITAYTAGLTATRAFATSTNCSARVVSTSGEAVNLTFRDRDIPTGTFGFSQLASTTVSYQAEEFGCNAVRIYGFGGDSTVSLQELR